MRKMTLLSLLLIGVVSATAGYSTMAYFNDTETSQDNTITTGVIELRVNGGDDPLETLVDVEAKPSQDRTVGPITVHNDGTNPGLLDLHLHNVTDSGGLNPEPEREAEAGIPLDNVSDVLNVDLSIDYDRDGDIDEILIPNRSVTLAQLESRILEVYREIEPGEQWDLYLSFHLKSNAGNEYQGDNSTFDIDFTLHQTNTGDDHEKIPQIIRLPDGFENWTLDGRGSTNLTTLNSLSPTNGAKMAYLATGNTGPGNGTPIDVSSAPGVPPGAIEGTTLHRNLTAPPAPSDLVLDYDFLTSDVPPFQDGLVGVVRHQNGSMETFLTENVSTAHQSGTAGFTNQTGWKTANVTLEPNEQVDVYLTVYDSIDIVGDSGTLIDNARFRLR